MTAAEGGAAEGPDDLPTVGVIGLGAIGDGVAASVHAAGFPLVVSDVREEATARHADHATVAASPADLARAADVVIVAVVNDEQVHAVLSGPDGALAAAGPDDHVRDREHHHPRVRPRPSGTRPGQPVWPSSTAGSAVVRRPRRRAS